MNNLILRMPIDGGADYLEVEASIQDQQRDLIQSEELQLTAVPSATIADVPFSFTSALDRVLPALETVVNKVRGGRIAPDELTIEVGLKAGGEQGFILAKGTAEANIKLTVKWISRSESSDPNLDQGAE